MVFEVRPSQLDAPRSWNLRSWERLWFIKAVRQSWDGCSYPDAHVSRLRSIWLENSELVNLQERLVPSNFGWSPSDSASSDDPSRSEHERFRAIRRHS